MIKVYIAGPITPTGSGNHAVEFLRNVQKGIETATELLFLGYAPFCPHLDFQYLLCTRRYFSAEKVYSLSIEWMLACDAILLLSDATQSVGWQRECKIAEYHSIPIFYSIEELKEKLCP